jgi:hypothetical protein
LSGVGSVLVICKQCHLHSAGWCIIADHFRETYPTHSLSTITPKQSIRTHWLDEEKFTHAEGLEDPQGEVRREVSNDVEA